MNSNKTVMGAFTSTYILTMAMFGDCTGGSVSPSVGLHPYALGTTVNLSASGTSTCQFVDWTGSMSGSTNPTSLVMNGNAGVTAHFAKNQYTLTVYKVGTGSGTITNPTEGTYTYARGTVVALGAGVPAAGSVWVGWLCDGQPCTSVTMDSNQSVYARFEPVGYLPTPTATRTLSVTLTPTSTPTNTPTHRRH